MQINSTPLGSSARLLIGAADTQTEPTQTIASDSPQSSSNEAGLSLASFVPADGLHSIAGAQPTTTAKFVGGDGFSMLLKALGAAMNPGSNPAHEIKGELGGRCTKDHD